MVVGLALDDGPRPVNLLEEDEPCDLMIEDHRGEADRHVGPLLNLQDDAPPPWEEKRSC